MDGRFLTSDAGTANSNSKPRMSVNNSALILGEIVRSEPDYGSSNKGERTR